MPRTKKSEFVSSAGTVFEVVKALADEVNSLGGNDDDLRRMLSDKSVARQVAELLVGKPELMSYPLTIDRERSRAEMVAAGGYDHVSPYIIEDNFPVEAGEARVEAVVVHLARTASHYEVWRELERQGLRPAITDELLAFGEQYPNSQRDPIVALGSVWQDPSGDFSGVIYIWDVNEVRYLNLWAIGDWEARWRFLAIRK